MGAAALAQSNGTVDRAILETRGFRFANLPAVDDVNFLPGGAKYHDLPGLLALAAPIPLHLIGEKERPAVTQAAYTAAGMRDRLSTEPDTDMPAAAVILRVLKH